MPHTRSAKRHVRKSEIQREYNKRAIREIKTHLKRVADTAKTGTLEQLTDAARTAISRLDRAASKRIVHPNLAARKKSQLARLLDKKKAAK